MNRANRPKSDGERGPRPDTCVLEEYWIGLDNIYALTNGKKQNNLRIDLQRYNGKTGTVGYDNFVIANDRDDYRLKSVGEFANDASVGGVGNSFVGAGFGTQGKILTFYIGVYTKISIFGQNFDFY